MSLTDAQISRILLGALKSGGAPVTQDDVGELDIYVENGYEYLEEQHTYDPRQYATNSSSIAVQYFAGWRFCSLRPNLADLSSFYQAQFERAEMDWAGQAAEQVNIHHNEYPENHTRVSWNNPDPLNMDDNVFGVDPNRLGT